MSLMETVGFLLGVSILAIVFLLILGAIVFIILVVVNLVEYCFAKRIHARWQADQCDIIFGPVPVRMLSLHRRKNTTVVGALGLIQGHLRFQGMYTRLFDISIPTEDICCIGVGRKNKKGFDEAQKPVHRVLLVLHVEKGWQVYTFSLRKGNDLVDVLSVATKLPVFNLELLHDWLPINATRMAQDIYGAWHPDFPGDLYLAGDRLLFAWQDAIMFEDIQALALYCNQFPREVLSSNLFHPNLLCITHKTGDGERKTAGFAIDPWGAKEWANALQMRSGVTLEIAQGRKIKT